MSIIQASESHFIDVMFLLRKCVEDMNQREMFNWNNSYPSPAMMLADIRMGNLYLLLETGICKGLIVLNESISDEYRDIEWNTKNERVLIVHRLAVNPLFQGKGIGRKLMEFAAQHARDKGYSALWLDVIETNQAANVLYRGMGFTRTGEFQFKFQESPFICYELRL